MSAFLVSLVTGILGEIAKRTVLKPEVIVDIIGRLLDKFVEGTDNAYDDILKGLLERKK